jgi:pimeloyl-ACP methyl ester carboxylesterase
METVYLIHGLMGTSNYHFAPQVQEWNTEYNLVLLDLPGHGDNPEKARTPFFEQGLTWVCDKIKEIGKGHIIGLSLGGNLAIHLALKYPELCKSIVLTGYVPSIPENLIGIMEEQYKMFLKVPEENPELAEEFMQLHGKRWYETLKIVLKEMTYNYPKITFEQIKDISVPTLVLNGSKEQHEREAASVMADLNSNIEIALLSGGGHTANLEEPIAYNIIVKSFWDRANLKFNKQQ